MKATTKKLITAIFVLAVAIALAASSTYAWFAMTGEVEVQPFNVDVTAGENLLIAVTTVGGDTPNLGAFKSYIATAEITDETDGVGRFYDLSGIVLYDNGAHTAEVLGLATADENLEFKANEIVPTSLLDGEAAYYAFDIHFISNSALGIMLADGTTVTSSGGDVTIYAWDDFAQEVYGVELAEGDAIEAAAANAVRIAFQTGEYSADGGDEGAPIPAEYNVYEPNADQGWGNYGGDDNIAVDHYNAKRTPTITTPATEPFETFVDADFDSTVLVTLADLEGDDAGTFHGKFTVKIWLEGWDADALDSIKAQVIAITLKFIGVEA